MSQHLSASALLKLWCILTQHWIISILLVLDHELRELKNISPYGHGWEEKSLLTPRALL